MKWTPRSSLLHSLSLSPSSFLRLWLRSGAAWCVDVPALRLNSCARPLLCAMASSVGVAAWPPSPLIRSVSPRKPGGGRQCKSNLVALRADPHFPLLRYSCLTASPSPSSVRAILRWRLRRAVERVVDADLFIARDGVSSLTDLEVYRLCAERGADPTQPQLVLRSKLKVSVWELACDLALLCTIVTCIIRDTRLLGRVGLDERDPGPGGATRDLGRSPGRTRGD